MAHHAAWVMSVHTKKPVDPKKLMGQKEEKKKTTPDQTNKLLDKLAKDMKVERVI